MNPFIQKKLGEVLAFARIGSETMEKGREGFLELLDEEDVDDLENVFVTFEQRLEEFAEKANVRDEVEEGASETFEKVAEMRDTYLEDEWTSESELLEWMGFYAGAAIVHWHLIGGAAVSLEIGELEGLSRDALDFYETLFVSDEKTLQDIGASRV